MIPGSNNANSESNNTSSEVMNSSPARRSNHQIVESLNNKLVNLREQIKKVKLRVVDTSNLFKMLRNAKDSKVTSPINIYHKLCTCILIYLFVL